MFGTDYILVARKKLHVHMLSSDDGTPFADKVPPSSMSPSLECVVLLEV